MATPVSHDCENSKRLPARQPIMDNIHAPAFGRPDWHGSWASVEGEVYPSPPAHPKLDLYSNGDKCLVGEIINCSENAGGQSIPKSGEQVASIIIFG
jgi:hypothetical protein